jgi:hypothetical protein
VTAEGDVVWQVSLGPSGFTDIRDVACDAAGSIYVTGKIHASGMRVYKYSALGGALWEWRKRGSGWGASLYLRSDALFMGGCIKDGDGVVIRFQP